MNEMGEPPAWLVVVFLAAVALVNAFGYFAWKRGRVADWYEMAILATWAPIAVGTIVGSYLVFGVGAVAHLVFGIYAAVRWFRPSDQLAARHKRSD